MLDGLLKGQFATGGVVAIVAIITVFVVLLAIIVLTELIGSLIEKSAKNETVAETVNAAPVAVGSPLDINDEDATVAALVASVDYRQETNMNIRVVSVKEVK